MGDETTEQKKIPVPTDPEWTKYVLDHLAPGEYMKDQKGNIRPKCDGLRRIFGLLMGDIVNSEADVKSTAMPSNNDRASVIFHISYLDKSGRQKYVSDGADVFPGNTKAPYCNFALATACTIAEGRTLKKALKLVGVTTVEEVSADISNDPAISTDLITEMQANAIRIIADRLDVDVGRLVGEMKIKATSLNDLTYSQAAEVITKLGIYDKGVDNGGEIVPENILKGD